MSVDGKISNDPPAPNLTGLVMAGVQGGINVSVPGGLFQPIDADLTAIAGLATQTYGRSLLTLASSTALATEVDPFFLTPAEGNAAYQPLDSDLTAIAALSTTAYGRSLLTLANLGALGALPGIDTTSYAGGSESARIAAMYAAAPTQPYAYRSDSHLGIIRDTSPLNYQGTRASFVLQHRDTATGIANDIIPGAVFQFKSTGDGAVTSGSDLSQTVWMGLYSNMAKTGDGSGHSFTCIGSLGAYGTGTYNELGGYCGEMTNTGSLHGTMSGVELLLKDSADSGVTKFDTTMNAIVGRVQRWQAGSRKSRNFYASAEGSIAIDAILGVNTAGTASWVDGINLVGATFSGNPIVVPNNTAIAARNNANSANIALIKSDTADNTLVLAGGGTTKSITFVNSANAISFNIVGVASSANYLEASGATATNTPLMVARGSDTNIGAGWGTKGTGVHSFYTGGNNFYKQVEIANVTTSVNYLQFAGAVTTGSPTIGALGSDTNIPITLTPKGAASTKLSTSLARGAPVTKTGNFTLADAENWLIANQAGTTTVTMPAASAYTGREVMFKTIQAQTLVSASSNVVPLVGGAAGTAILAATAGKWATLVSDGTNWIIMQGN